MASHKGKGWRERHAVRRAMVTLQKRAALLQGFVTGLGDEPATEPMIERFEGLKKSLKAVIRALKAQKKEEKNR